jgi:hypothetical protein
MSGRKTVYRCRYCDCQFIEENFEPDRFDEVLMGHVQMNHEYVFENIEHLECPDAIEDAYVRTVYE